MPLLPINDLRSKYEELSELFITEVNNTEIIVHYPSPNPPSDFTLDDRPRFIDEYGGKIPIQNQPDRYNEEGDNKVVSTVTETIKGRVYWNPKNIAKEILVQFDKDFCKINTYASNEVKLNNALFLEINGRRVKKVIAPFPYGLFGKQYCVSYWQVMNG
jgi:hypothetical protein